MKTAFRALTASLAASMMSAALAGTPPLAPAEVAAAAPAGTSLLTFKSSVTQAHAYAVAVYQTAPDQDGVRYRSLIIFGAKDGKFIPEVTSDKLIACSKCSPIHDDPFAFSHLILAPGHIHIDQMAAGREPSVVILDFAYKQGKWYVTRAERELWADVGRYKSATERLPLPKSGLVQDLSLIHI